MALTVKVSQENKAIKPVTIEIAVTSLSDLKSLLMVCSYAGSDGIETYCDNDEVGVFLTKVFLQVNKQLEG